MPVEIQARIAAIQSRFTAAAPPATSANGSEFSAALASMNQANASALLGGDDSAMASLLGTGTGTDATSLFGTALGTTGSNVLTPQQQQLVSSALASRNAAFGITGIGTATGATAANGYGTTTSRIASKAAVENIEKTLTNGKLRDDQLTSIGVGSHKLHPEASNAFKQLKAAAEADGIDFGVTDSYRSYDAQVDVARRKGLYSQGGLAAKPGTSSHGYGLAVDLDLDAKALNWMRTNAGRFGFVEDTPRETWHWKFDGV